MPLPFGNGELAARARTGLDLRGRIPFALDEVLVPTVSLLELDRAPFRTDGVEWWGSNGRTPAAGQFAQVAVTPGDGAQAVVDQIIISNVDPAAALFVAYLLPTLFSQSTCVSSELQLPTAPASVVANVPVDVQVADAAAAHSATTIPLFQVQLASNQSIVIPCEIELRPRYMLTIQGGAINIDVVASFRGRLWRLPE